MYSVVAIGLLCTQSELTPLSNIIRRYQCCGSGSETGSESGSGSTCFWASRIRIQIHYSEVWIRIRVRIRIRILLSSCKNSLKNLDSYYFVTLFDFLSLKNDVNIPSESGSGSISQRHGSADPDLDPHQNVMDPQHWKIHSRPNIPTTPSADIHTETDIDNLGISSCLTASPLMFV
jgi:hypothetical protein